MHPKIIIFTLPTCGYCLLLKEFLKKSKVEFIEKDVLSDPDSAHELFRLTGQSTVPVLFYQGSFVVGYDLQKIKNLIWINMAVDM